MEVIMMISSKTLKSISVASLLLASTIDLSAGIGNGLRKVARLANNGIERTISSMDDSSYALHSFLFVRLYTQRNRDDNK